MCSRSYQPRYVAFHLNCVKLYITDKEDNRRFQAIIGSVPYLVQATRYDTGYAVNHLTWATSKSSKAYMAATKYLHKYLAGTTNFAIFYKLRGFKLTTSSDANWGNSPDNGKYAFSHLALVSNGLVSFKVGLQRLTAQSTMEAELVAAALTTKEAVF